jgi:hypothetical protein
MRLRKEPPEKKARKCVVCKRKMSIYNSSDRCFYHSYDPDYNVTKEDSRFLKTSKPFIRSKSPL